MAKAKRARRTITIDVKIKAAQDAVARQKARYDKAVVRLETLMAKREEIRTKELMTAIASSDRSYEEVLQFIKG